MTNVCGEPAKSPSCCLQATIQLTPLLWTQLKKLGDDLYGVNGLASVPTSDAEFLTRLKNILICALPFHAFSRFFPLKEAMVLKSTLLPWHAAALLSGHVVGAAYTTLGGKS